MSESMDEFLDLGDKVFSYNSHEDSMTKKFIEKISMIMKMLQTFLRQLHL